ncbi:MAG: carbohydrate ABC transporter permease [Treponema sp.]|jgi:ABC-type glycerol-3-phosphate transport system permease component|nr:carbohydrate ABC transporter permease [Treponema sp.]
MKANIAEKAGKTITFALLLVFFTFIIIPFVMILLTALKLNPEIVDMPNRTMFHRIFPDSFFNFVNIKNVFLGNTVTQNGFPLYRAILNSLIVVLVTIIPSLILALTAAYSFAKFKFPGKEIFYYLFLGMLMIPTEMTSIPLFMIVSKLRLVNTYPGLMVPSFMSAFGTFLLRAAMEPIPKSYIEAGRIDGAGEFWIFRAIVIPMVQSHIVTFLVIKSVWTWNDFFWPLLVVTEDRMRTVTLSLNRFVTDLIQYWGEVCAAVVISIIPLLIIFIVFNANIKTGLMNTGIKG